MRGTLLPLVITLSFVAFAVAAPAPPASAPAGDAKAALPTMAELRQQFKDAQHQDVLKHAQRLLQLKGDAAKGYNKYELHCLRGECLLRTRATSLAADAFDDAAEVARDESKRAGVARGTAVLIRRSKPLGYVPRPAKAEGGAALPAAKVIPIIEEADRRVALLALLADERGAVVAKLDAAQSGVSLPAIIDVARLVGDLWAIEVAATGSGDETRAMAKDLGALSHGLIATALDSMNDRVEGAWREASVTYWTVYKETRIKEFNGRVGLHGESRNAVVFALEQTRLIAPAARELWKVTGNDALKRDAEVAQKLFNRAVYVLEFKYQTQKQDRRPVPPAPRAGETRDGKPKS